MDLYSTMPMRQLRGPLVLLSALLVLSPTELLAQSDGVLQHNEPVYSFLQRMQTSGHIPDAFLSHQPLSAYEARKYLDQLDEDRSSLTVTDRNMLDRYLGRRENRSASKLNSWLPFVYGNGRDMIEVKGEDYAIQLNPLAYLSAGPAAISSDQEGDETRLVTNNTRGFRASGHIGDGIFFETRLETRLEDAIFPMFAHRTAPRRGIIKFDASQEEYDYFVVTGIAGYKSKHFEVRFGRDNNRWGYGLNSLLLSNYGPVYDHLQIRTSVGPFQYTNIFAGLNDLSGLPNSFGDQVIPKKFGTFHRLSVKLPYRFELDLFETVIAAPDSSKMRFNGYDLSYLNPIIFYRAVEYDRGSPDNVLVGAGLSWLPFPKLFVYGQALFDEFRFSEITSGDGWWANKWGALAGLHTTPTPNLDARFEYAQVRPFTYSHGSPISAYIHNDDILGLQSGPNSKTFVLDANYRPSSRMHVGITYTRTENGRNSDTVNYGGDARVSNTTREDDYGHSLLQGIAQTTSLLETRFAYEWLPRVFLEGGLRYQNLDDAENGVNSYLLPFASLRWGIPYRFEKY